jgi:hypothetical protein
MSHPLLTLEDPKNVLEGFWGILLKAVDENGAAAVTLVVVLALFYKLVWKVWNATLESKNDEIGRLITTRDRYQALVFERLLSSAPAKPDDPDTPDPSEPKKED